jgi:hypothetical protein
LQLFEHPESIVDEQLPELVQNGFVESENEHSECLVHPVQLVPSTQTGWFALSEQSFATPEQESSVSPQELGEPSLQKGSKRLVQSPAV